MTTEFASLNLRPELAQAVAALGYEEPTPIQAGIIPLMLSGADAIGQAQTGTGKTAAFALPILHNLPSVRSTPAPQALIVTPTRELALQVSEAFSDLGRFCNAQVCAIYGGSSYSRQISQLRRGVDVVVGTPGRLLDLMQRELLDLSTIRTVVLDEADEMLSMGFIEDIEAILAATPAERQTALFSATMPGPIRRLAEQYMRQPQFITIQREQVTVAATEQRCYVIHQADKTAALARLFEMEEVASALIFVRTRAGTGDLANALSLRGFPAEALNGDLSQEARERTLSRFRQGQVKVLVATDVAARGLDIDGITHVFNYDMPGDAEIYVHRIGRTGRAGKTGVAITLATPYECRRLRDIERFTRQAIPQANLPSLAQVQERRDAELVKQIKVWIQRGRCRQEKAIVEAMVAEGSDLIEVAAAALKIARADEKRRPVAPVQEVVETVERDTRRGDNYAAGAYRTSRESFQRDGRRNSDRTSGERRSDERGTWEKRRSGERPERRPGGADNHRPGYYREGSSSHEPGMVRLKMNMGHAHGIRPADVVGAIAFHADISGSTIGKIYIEDQHTFVDVPEQFIGQVLDKAGQYNIRKQAFKLERA